MYCSHLLSAASVFNCRWLYYTQEDAKGMYERQRRLPPQQPPPLTWEPHRPPSPGRTSPYYPPKRGSREALFYYPVWLQATKEARAADTCVL